MTLYLRTTAALFLTKKSTFVTEMFSHRFPHAFTFARFFVGPQPTTHGVIYCGAGPVFSSLEVGRVVATLIYPAMLNSRLIIVVRLIKLAR